MCINNKWIEELEPERSVFIRLQDAALAFQPWLITLLLYSMATVNILAQYSTNVNCGKNVFHFSGVMWNCIWSSFQSNLLWISTKGDGIDHFPYDITHMQSSSYYPTDPNRQFHHL